MTDVPDFTIVCGVDDYHLEQLAITWPTWMKNKPSLLNHPMVVFYDRDGSSSLKDDIKKSINHPDLTCWKWPPLPTPYPGRSKDKFTNPQRYKMLAGFVHVSWGIYTSYMLKLDTDVIATDQDDWIDPTWFDGNPAVVSHPWSFTKPADQILTLDRWVYECRDKLPDFEDTEPLKLAPKPGSDRVGHKRIISWCSFWDVRFIRRCSTMAKSTCGDYKLPVPSQDGFLWYCAKRLNQTIVRPNMKKRGWGQWCTMGNVRKHVEEAMKG